MVVDFKAAINKDIAELDLALIILNSLRDTNLERLKLLDEAEKRSNDYSDWHWQLHTIA